MLILFMYLRFSQYFDSATCLLGSLNNLDVDYVLKVLYKILALFHSLFTWRSGNVDFGVLGV